MVDTNNQQIEYELRVPLRGTKVGWGVFAYPTAALLRSLQWVSERYVSPRDTALTMYNNLLWKAAWLRRDAIASYVCLVCCNSQLNNSKSQAKPRIIQNS